MGLAVAPVSEGGSYGKGNACLGTGHRRDREGDREDVEERSMSQGRGLGQVISGN